MSLSLLTTLVVVAYRASTPSLTRLILLLSSYPHTYHTRTRAHAHIHTGDLPFDALGCQCPFKSWWKYGQKQ